MLQILSVCYTSEVTDLNPVGYLVRDCSGHASNCCCSLSSVGQMRTSLIISTNTLPLVLVKTIFLRFGNEVGLRDKHTVCVFVCVCVGLLLRHLSNL